MASENGSKEAGCLNPSEQTPQMRKLWAVFLMALIVAAGLFLEAAAVKRVRAERGLAKQKRLAAQAVSNLEARRPTYFEARLPARTTFMQFLENHGLPASSALAMIQASHPVFNLARVRAGNRVTILRTGGQLRAVYYRIDSLHTLSLTRQPGGYQARIQRIHYQDRVAGVAGTVRGSLFQAVEAKHETPELAAKVAQVFSWTLDFNTESQPGDRFAALVNKRFLNSRFEGYGRVLAAEYLSAHHRYEAILFHTPSGRPAYYGPSGKSLQKEFLRSPLKFAARITSGFSYHRFHPILRRYLPHLGIDYAAPLGSPVQAVASGTVLYAGWKRAVERALRWEEAGGS